MFTVALIQASCCICRPLILRSLKYEKGTCENRYISFPPPDITVGLVIGAVVLVLLLIVGGVLVFAKQRKKRNEKIEEERTDDNPVYATYEVHDDPVAEVKTLKPVKNFDPISRKINPVFFQAIDLNLDYGTVYKGEEMSKTTDVNPDYDD